MTTFAKVEIEGVDYKADVLRAELTRTVNAVGSWEILLRNTGGVYKNTFDVQDELDIAVDNIADRLMIGKADGPAVSLIGRDLESIWDEYVLLKGVDNGQDLLFHNDFAYNYPDVLQTLDDVLTDVFVQLGASTNLAYIPVVGTPTVGAFEFKEGASFLGQIQELHRRAGWIFYVDDGLLLSPMDAMAPTAAPVPNTFSSVALTATNNIIGFVNYQTRDGDKHYNYVRLYGKAPMFDGWTEYNAASWTGNNSTITDETANTMVGDYAIRATTDGINPNYSPVLDFSPAGGLFNYTTLNLTSGSIGCWIYQHNGDSPDVYMIQIRDTTGNIIQYGGASTTVRNDIWGWIEAPISITEMVGYDSWSGDSDVFNWDAVDAIGIGPYLPPAAVPDYFIVDGLTIPLPIVSIKENIGAQAAYRRRPYVDAWPHVRTQNALDECAQQILTQSESTLIQRVKFTTPGTKSLRYAGQSINLLVPSLDIDDGLTPPGPAIYYITGLRHIIEPHVDVSQGYGFDWITEVEAVPVSTIGYDQGRLRVGSTYSVAQSAGRLGAGVRSR